MSLKELQAHILKQPKVLAFIKKRDLTFVVSETIHEARFRRDLTQAELAEKMGTTQSAIARIEKGRSLPSLTFLDKMARAFGTHLIIKFAFMVDYEPLPDISIVTDNKITTDDILGSNVSEAVKPETLDYRTSSVETVVTIGRKITNV